MNEWYELAPLTARQRRDLAANPQVDRLTGWTGAGTTLFLLHDLPDGGVDSCLSLYRAEYQYPSGMSVFTPVSRSVRACIRWESDSGETRLCVAAPELYEACVEYLSEADSLEAHVVSPQTSDATVRPLRSSSTPTQYTAHVAHIRHRILAGDLFQANLSRELTVEWPGATRADVAGFAERLLAQTNAPFGAVLHEGTHRTIISASPERFFRVERLPDGRLKVIAEPIKGTRPRHADPVIDQAAARELLASEKDRAENVMIADLVRNDLSLVCEDDSVTVERLCELRSFASVHHLVTTVTGVLRPGLTALDALRAQFPCGSITGAPKLAAMDLIAELEQRERGIYCGAIGYVAADGSADFSVAIRTAIVDYYDGGVTIRYGVGGGVTALSDPEAEYQETEDKAADFLRALRP